MSPPPPPFWEDLGLARTTENTEGFTVNISASTHSLSFCMHFDFATLCAVCFKAEGSYIFSLNVVLQLGGSDFFLSLSHIQTHIHTH